MMAQKPFGRSGLWVTPLGLGLAALGRPGYINLGHAADLEGEYDPVAMEARAHALLDAAWRAGVRYFDVARSYGRAEAFLSAWLRARQLRPEQVTVGSKWGYMYTAGWQVETAEHEIKEHSLAVLERQLAESRAWLGDQLDLYQIHSATLASGVLEKRPLLAALGRLRDQGLVIGLSLSGPDQAETLRRALAVEVDGRPLFGGVQATWNLLEPSAGPALAEAHQAGLGVIVKEALANGRLTARNSELAFAPKRRLLEEAAAGLGATVDALALAAGLAQPWADVVLSGAATLEQLASNLGALDLGWDAALAARVAPLVEPPAGYWARRAELAWN
ncbi:MAG: aldo/keto reductase [Candidatus Promineifilaceae bacterium]